MQHLARLFVVAALSALALPLSAQTTAGSATTIVIPVTAQTASFTSESTVQNPNGVPITVGVAFYEANNSSAPGPKTCANLAVPANRSAQFTLAGQCTLAAGSHFGLLVLNEQSGNNPIYGYVRTQNPQGIGFSTEGFPAGNFNDQVSHSTGLKKTTTGLIYQTNCFVGSLAQHVSYTLKLFDDTTGVQIGGTLAGSLNAFEQFRYLDIFGASGVNAPNVDQLNVRAEFTPTTTGTLIGFCTVQDNTSFGADFRIAKSYGTPGTVTSLAQGAGITLTPNPITTTGTVAADTAYLQRRVSSTCAVGSSIRAIAADGTVTCQSDTAGGSGTVTSITAGTGLTGGVITATGTIAADTAYLQRRVSSTCAAGSSIRVIANDGTVTCQTDSTGPANAFVQNGNAFGAIAVLGTTDNFALDLRANNSRVMRFEPNVTSPNLIGGDPVNGVTAGALGATIGGGGKSGADCFDPVTGLNLRACRNFVTDDYGTIGGGLSNRVGSNDVTTTNATHGAIGGGEGNTASGAYSTIAGGQYGTASDTFGSVGGGYKNRSTGNKSTIAGGSLNTAVGVQSTVGGGAGNDATGEESTVSGGQSNAARNDSSTVGGGSSNQANGAYSSVGGGLSNVAGGTRSTVSGGQLNAANGIESTVGGGHNNQALGQNATVAGGGTNSASGTYSTVSGGVDNVANGTNWSTVGGGHENTASGPNSTVVGGASNVASGNASSVLGGDLNFATGVESTVVGGKDNVAGGDFSVAMGRHAKALGDGSFAFADSNQPDFSSNTTNAFRVRATGGVRFVVDIDNTGATTWSCLLSTGNGWNCSSDRNLKQDLVALDGRDVLAKLAAMPVYQWQPKGRNAHVRHYGPMAQDFHAAFGLGDDDKMIGMQDADGVALAAIQGLNAKLEHRLAEKDVQLAVQRREIDDLRERVARAEFAQADLVQLRAMLQELQRDRSTIAAR